MISVIIPIYNVEDYLGKCLNSVLNNTYRELEVICVNDGSTDRCADVLKKMQEKDNRIVIVDQENKGLPEARNSGLRIATGEYIAFIDSDDWVHPLYFESMLRCMKMTGADMVVCGCRKFGLEEEIETDLPKEIQFRRYSAKDFYTNQYYARHMVWARIIRRKDAQKICFPPEVLPLQDTLFNLRIISGIQEPLVYGTDAELYFYLQRPGSLVRSQPYDTTIEMVDWFVKKGRDPLHIHYGEWGWMLIMQSISTTLSCRYSAYLWNNQDLVNHTNMLLRILSKDMLSDRYVGIKKKLLYSCMIKFPKLYRIFRLHNDPTLREYERNILAKNIYLNFQ